MKKFATAVFLIIFVSISLYLDRYSNEVADRTWYNLTQVALTAICAALVLWLTDWLKVAAFAILALVFVELCQQLINGNTEVNLSDNVSLIIIIVSVGGFILVRRYKKML